MNILEKKYPVLLYTESKFPVSCALHMLQIYIFTSILQTTVVVVALTEPVVVV